MKASFSVTNAFRYGLKFLGNRSRVFRSFVASADLDLCWSSSSEDEVFEVEQPLYLSNSSVKQCDSVSNRRCIHNNQSVVWRSFVDCQLLDECIKEHAVSELEVVECWNFGSPYFYGDNLDETKVIKGLNDVFKHSSDANLALYFFKWLEFSVGYKHTFRSVCAMAYILVCGNMNHRAVELVARLVGESESENPQHSFLLKVLNEVCVSRNEFETLCSMLVKCYVADNLSKVAVSLVCEMEHLDVFPSLPTCNVLLSSLLCSDQEEAAWDLFEKMHSRKVVNITIVSLFISHYCQKSILGSAWKLLIDMRGFGIEPDVVSFSILISSLCKMSRPKEATLFLFKMIGLGISPDPVSLSCIVDGYSKMAKGEELLLVLDFFSVPFNIHVYNSLLSMFCREGDMIKAFSTFQEMVGSGFIPDCFSYSTMIDGYCKAKDINKALEFLGNMLKVGIDPSVATYTTLIGSYCGSGDIESAEYMFEGMKKEGVVLDVIVYNTLLNGYAKSGQLHKAYELLNLMETTEVSPDIVTYNILIHGLAVRGFVNEAKYILEELLRRGFPTDAITFTPIIGGFSNRGQFEEAFLVWNYISKHNMKPDVITCSALINGYCRARQMDEALDLFKRTIDAGLLPDLILYNTMIHGFCSLGNIEDACILLKMMVGQGVVPNDVTLQALVRAYEKTKIENPVEIAVSKLQEIILDSGLQV